MKRRETEEERKRRKLRERERREDSQPNEQILIEDGTMSAFGLRNSAEVPVRRKG